MDNDACFRIFHYSLVLPIDPIAQYVLFFSGMKPISSSQDLLYLSPCTRSIPGYTDSISLSELYFKISKSLLFIIIFIF